MASRKRRLKVIVSPIAREDIADIWRWNAATYNVSHADRYIELLTQAIYNLDKDHGRGRIVTHRPELRYIVIRRRPRGHGHIAVYTVDDDSVNVLHLFHTAQDWQSKI
jgi:plasmid stabilization system protein ParE